MISDELKDLDPVLKVEHYRSSIENADGFSTVWTIVKDSIKDSLGEYRGGMLLFLDDLPLRVGAYHPLGTNNIVLNRSLVHMVEDTTRSKRHVNAFIYSLLAHEYLHALGYVIESEVRHLVYQVSKECFGEDHLVTSLAEKSPWTILKGVPLERMETPKGPIEVVKDFEKPNRKYIV